MDRDAWDDRRRGLEEEFFAKQNRELMAKLREQQSREKARQELEQALGIKDTKALDSLLDSGVTPSTALALALVPLVTVAWADHKMEAKERDAIIKAAGKHGLVQGTAAYDLLLSWLQHEPEPSLFQAWAHYIKGLRAALSTEHFAALQSQIMDRVRSVAAATGGFLGLGPKVSDLEQREIDRLAQAFH